MWNQPYVSFFTLTMSVKFDDKLTLVLDPQCWGVTSYIYVLTFTF